MKVLGYESGNALFKFCERREYCEQIAAGSIYMKANGYFRQLDDCFRGDPVDGRIMVQREDRREWHTWADGSQSELIFTSETAYGVENDDQMPVFCATLFDGAIVEPRGPGATTTRFCDEFVQEISQFGRYVVCLDLEEVILQMVGHAYRNRYECRYARVEYFDTRNAFSDLDDLKYLAPLFPFAFFKKDSAYCWQNEWRCVLTNTGNTIIPFGRDSYVVQEEPFESARIFRVEELLGAPIEL